MMIDYQ